MKKITTKLNFEAKKGDKLHLDNIYNFQGLGESGGINWWSSCDCEGVVDDGDGDLIIILRDVKISITVIEG